MQNSIEARNYILEKLKDFDYPLNYLNDLLKYLGIDPLQSKPFHLTEIKKSKVIKIISQLENDIPIEYIIGQAYFFGNKYEVSSDVLIPRSDTENLVETVKHNIKEIGQDLTIIDIGTGSGCIIISLAKIFEQNSIEFWATDISSSALEIAERNRERIVPNIKINFIKANFAPQQVPQTNNVLIISNPPYINDKDMKHLPKSVKYEPELALRENKDFINIMQKYINELTEKGKNVHVAIEYSQSGKMIQRFANPLQVSLKELLK